MDPASNPDTQPYWDALREGRLRLQRCAACGVIRHYPRPVCASCFSMDVTWIDAAGTGTVHSWTETHHPFLPELRETVPYVLITATLEEGVRLLAQLRGSQTGLQIGAPLHIEFEPLDDQPVPVVVLDP